MRSIRLNSLGIRLPSKSGASRAGGLKLALDPDAIEDLDLVADFHVVTLNANTAFHAVTDFRHVVLEATQGFQLAFKDNHVVPQNPDRLVTVNCAFGDHTTGHLTKLRRTEHVPDI